MRYALVFVAAVLVAALLVSLACRRESARPVTGAAPEPPAAGTLKARAVSWDIGFHPPTESEWIARVVHEVRDASAAGVDVLVWPELFASGLLAYAPDERPHEWGTRRVSAALLPAVKAATAPGMLVCLGSYAHQENGWKHARNRSPVLLNGTWHFVDKVHPTPGERVEEPPIEPGSVLPVFEFRGGRVAVLVCFTLEMPEVSAALKKEDVHLILAPTATADEDGAARVLRTASARAVELGAAVLVAPLVGTTDGWKNVGSAACYLPAQKGIDHRPRESPRRTAGTTRDDFVIPWQALLNLRHQDAKPETRPFLAAQPFKTERR
ncbi:MAG TPA: nitrilase-related carbon-nitrogen hydrolase [Gemmata sp.]